MNTNKNAEIDYNLSLFGIVPYGKTVIAPVVVADPIDFCDGEQINPYWEHLNLELHPFLIMERGGCDFVLKVRNAQNHRALMAIVVDT